MKKKKIKRKQKRTPKPKPLCRMCQKPCLAPFGIHEECAYKGFYEEVRAVFLKYFPMLFVHMATPLTGLFIRSLSKTKSKRRKS